MAYISMEVVAQLDNATPHKLIKLLNYCEQMKNSDNKTIIKFFSLQYDYKQITNLKY